MGKLRKNKELLLFELYFLFRLVGCLGIFEIILFVVLKVSDKFEVWLGKEGL